MQLCDGDYRCRDEGKHFHLFMCEFMLFVYLWGHQDLKYKILIKNKKLKNHVEAESASGTEAEESVDDAEDEEEEEDEDEEEEEERQSKAKFWLPRKAVAKTKVSQLGTEVFCTDIIECTLQP